MIAKELTVGLAVLVGCVGMAFAADAPEAVKPSKEHEWLAQFAGEWTSESEMVMAPGQPPVKCSGTEKGRMLGGLWMVAEIDGKPMGQPMHGVMTLGYDPQKKKYTGTWIDSMMNHMWRYEGSLDESGNVLTLEAEGPNPMAEGKAAKYRDVVEFKSKDHKVLTSSMQDENGKWVQFMTSTARRKK